MYLAPSYKHPIRLLQSGNSPWVSELSIATPSGVEHQWALQLCSTKCWTGAYNVGSSFEQVGTKGYCNRFWILAVFGIQLAVKLPRCFNLSVSFSEEWLLIIVSLSFVQSVIIRSAKNEFKRLCYYNALTERTSSNIPDRNLSVFNAVLSLQYTLIHVRESIRTTDWWGGIAKRAVACATKTIDKNVL